MKRIVLAFSEAFDNVRPFQKVHPSQLVTR
jgi:hypothetical protein